MDSIRAIQTDIYLFKVNNGYPRPMFEIYSNSVTKTPEQFPPKMELFVKIVRYISTVNHFFKVYVEHIFHIVLLFLLLTLN